MVLEGMGRHGGGRRGRHRRGGRRGPIWIPGSYIPGPETVFVEADRVPEEDDNAIPDRPEEIIEAAGGSSDAITGLGDVAGGLGSSRLLWFVVGMAAAAGARKMGWWR